MTDTLTVSADNRPFTGLAPVVNIHPEFDSPLLRDLLHPSHIDWTPRELRQLTITVAGELTMPLRTILRYEPAQRWWARLALTERIELWLLSWLPGQTTQPHDHGGASGSFTVLAGHLSEEYRYPGGPIHHRWHTTGDSIGFGAYRAHRVYNADDLPAASVHAYSPPLVPTREYASLLDVPAEVRFPAEAADNTAEVRFPAEAAGNTAVVPG